MLLVSSLLMMLAVISRVGCVRNTPRTARASRNEAALEFECPEEFGYYPHPRDCTQYYVCVFGGALLESCTGGLMYSHELQTCDWPRNVGCHDGGPSAKETEDDDPLLERSAKAESQQRGPPQRATIHRNHGTSPTPPISQITERQSRHRQHPQRTTYQDDEYEPASEIESDRQQRVHRGQQSIIGQVQRDRDGLRRNIISVSSTHPSRSLHSDYVTLPPSEYGNDNVGHETTASSTTTTTTMTTTTLTAPSSVNQEVRNTDNTDYAIHDATKRNYVIVSSPSPFKLPPKFDYETTMSSDLTTILEIQNDGEASNNILETSSRVEDKSERQITTQSTIPEDSEQHNEISVPSPSPRKRLNYDSDVGNSVTVPSKTRQRVKARIAQRGRERYQSSVTMKVTRKRPANDRDQIGKDSLGTDVTVPLVRSTTPKTNQRKIVLSPRKFDIDSLDSNDIPTTLSPFRRALIVAQLGDQEEVERNEISATPSISRTRFTPDTTGSTSIPRKNETIITTTTTTTTTTSTTATSTSPTSTSNPEISTQQRDEIDRNEITVTPTGQPSSSTSLGPQVSRQRQRDSARRSSTLEREKDSLSNSRTQTENHYRAISSENPRLVKTIASTTSTPVISKSYFDPESYPFYALYDDDVSIYKDDDYTQYTVNQSVIQPPQQQNVRIAEVTPNSKSYTPKPKKAPVSDADKYNLNSEVTVSDYDNYDNQAQLNKNKFRINDGQQSYRTNGLNHQVVLTTPNAIVDTYVPQTTPTPTTTTTARPFSVTVQSRGRPQVNRGTAPPRLRPTLKPSTEIVSKAQEFVDIYRHPAVRPAPIYPTPTVDKPAAKCRKDVCLLPDCSCGGASIPGDFLPEETPQIVLLTFDDSVNDLNKGLYADLFEKGRKNPNGCPISATFYVSHEWTDYSQVQNLYASGHEIASHTVSHSFGEQFSARKWSREVAGQREILAAYGGVKLEDVRGMRAPFLSVGGNNMFKMLWDTNFTYDSSMPIYENRPPSWPYTLDYKLFHDCMIPPCPTRSYPGLWEVPMVMWQDLNGGRCSMGDACSNPPTPDGVYKMLIKNFERHYTTNRAPFGLFYHAAWFTQQHHKEGFISFLDTIVAMDDVWVVTNWQALQWVRNPTPLGLLNNFEPFSCNYADRPKRCNNARVCNLWHKSGVRYMKTCQPCPDIYPWTGKTGIQSSRIDNDIEN